MLLSVPPTSHTAPPRPSASKEPAGNTASSNALVKQGQSAPGIVVVVALVVVVVVVVVDVVVVEAVVVDVVVGDPPLRSSTHASAVASMASHGWVCAVQSPLLCAFVHEEVNLDSHLASLTVSTATPLCCALAMTLVLQATFLPAAFVTPASQLDCACATPLSASDRATSPPTTNDASMCSLPRGLDLRANAHWMLKICSFPDRKSVV